METLDNEVRILGDTEKSYIRCTESSVKIVVKGKENIMNPTGVITVIPKVQLELGREFEEFRKLLKEVRKPIGYQKIAEIRHQATYKIFRMRTGNVPDVEICAIRVFKGVMTAVSFNHKLNYNEDYKKYEMVSSLNQLRAGKEGDKNLVNRAKLVVGYITNESLDNISTEEKANRIVVNLNSTNGNRYQYDFIKDTRGYYTLMRIIMDWEEEKKE